MSTPRPPHHSGLKESACTACNRYSVHVSNQQSVWHQGSSKTMTSVHKLACNPRPTCLQSAPCSVASLELACVCPVAVWSHVGCVIVCPARAGCVIVYLPRAGCVIVCVCQSAVCMICVSVHCVCVISGSARDVLVCLPRAGCLIVCLPRAGGVIVCLARAGCDRVTPFSCA